MNEFDGVYLLAAPDRLDYLDRRSVDLPRPLSPLAAWNLMIAQSPPIMRRAFWLRDVISARFGVKKIGGFTVGQQSTVAVGDYLDFFLVEAAEPHALVLTERDRHLDVMTCISVEDRRLTITSSVVVYNAFGRAYMLVVGPVHKVIVHSLLSRLVKVTKAEGSDFPG